MRRGVVRSLVGAPPTVAVWRDGTVYRNTAPLRSLPWRYSVMAEPDPAAR